MYTEEGLLEAVDILIEDYELTENEALNIINEYQGNLAANPTKVKGSGRIYFTPLNNAKEKLDDEKRLKERRNDELLDKKNRFARLDVDKEEEKRGKTYYEQGYEKGNEERNKKIERDASNLGRYSAEMQKSKDNKQYELDKKNYNRRVRKSALKAAATGAIVAGSAIAIHKAYKNHNAKKEEERRRAEEEARKTKNHKKIKRLREDYGIFERNNELYIKNESVEYFMDSYNTNEEDVMDIIIESYINELNEVKSLYKYNSKNSTEENFGPQRRRGESKRHYASREREYNYENNKILYDERNHQEKLKALEKDYQNKKEQEKQRRQDVGYKDAINIDRGYDTKKKSFKKEDEYLTDHNKKMDDKYDKLNKNYKRKKMIGTAAGAVVGAGTVILAHKAYKHYKAKNNLKQQSKQKRGRE